MEYFSLQNIINLNFKRSRHSDLACLQLCFTEGSSCESVEELGFTHFSEHVIARYLLRSKNSIGFTIQDLGIEFNAYTNFDLCTFQFTFNKSDLDFIIDIILKLFTEFNLEMNNFEEEKKAILTEIELNKRNIDKQLIEQIHRDIFSGHAYSHNITGQYSTVENIQLHQLSEFIKNKLFKASPFVVLVADINIENTFSKLGLEYKRNSNYRNKENSNFPITFNENSIERTVLNTNLNRLCLSYKISPATEGDFACYLILNEFIKNHFHKLKSTIPNFNLSMSIATYRDSWVINFYILSTHDEINELEICSLLITLIDEVNKISDFETIKLLVIQNLIEKISVTSVSDKLVKLFSSNCSIIDQDVITAIKNLNENKFKRTIGLNFQENASWTILSKKEKTFIKPIHLKYPSWSKLYAEPENEDTSFYRPISDVTRTSTYDLEIKKIAHFNASELIQLKTGKNPFKNIQIYLNFGYLNEDSNLQGLNEIICGLLRSKSNIFIEKSRIKKPTQLEFINNRHYLLIKIKTIETNDKLIVDLIYLILNTTDIFDNFQFVKNRIQTLQKNVNNDIAQKTFNTFIKLMFNDSQFTNMQFGNEKSLEHITEVETLKTFKDINLKTAKNILLNADEIDTENWVELFHRINTQQGSEHVQKSISQISNVAKLNIDSRIISKNTSNSDICHVITGFKTTQFDTEDQYILKLIYSLLDGSGGKLEYRLRSQNKFVYSALPTRIESFNEGFFAIYANTLLKNLNATIAESLSILTDLSTEKITEKELNRAKNYYKIKKNIESQNINEIMEIIGLNLIFKRSYENDLSPFFKVSNTTADQILEVSKKYFSPSELHYTHFEI